MKSELLGDRSNRPKKISDYLLLKLLNLPNRLTNIETESEPTPNKLTPTNNGFKNYWAKTVV